MSTARLSHTDDDSLRDLTRLPSHVGGWEYDVAQGTVYWTAEVYRLHDLPPNVPLADWQDYHERSLAGYDPPGRDLLRAAFDRCADEGRPYDLELPFTTPTGRHLWVRTVAQPVWEGSRIVKVVGSMADITARKQAEVALKQRMEQLQHSERHFRMLVEQLPAVVYLSALDATGSTLYISPHLETLLGYTPAEWIADPQLMWRSVHPDDIEAAQAHHDRQRTTVQPMHREYRLIARTGHVVWVSEDSTVIVDDQGNPQASQGVVLDITVRRQAEERLRLMHAITEASHSRLAADDALTAVAAGIQRCTGWEAIGIRVVDDASAMPYVAQVGFAPAFNDLAGSLNARTGCSVCCALTSGDADVVPWDGTSRRTWCTADVAALLAGLPEATRGNVCTLCARMGYRSVALIPLRERESIVGLIHMVDRRTRVAPDEDVRMLEDVADHVCTTIRRVEAESRLRAALAEKEALLREVHHRVKNNFASVMGLVELQRDTLADGTPADMLTDLSGRIRSMAIVHELLYQSESLREIDLHEYLHVLISRLPLISSSGAAVHFRIEASGIQMSLDAAIPSGLIINELVTNALKYAFPGGRPCAKVDRCEIAITATWDGAFYVLTVTDNGVGLPADLDWAAGKTLGLRLVRLLARHQLHGQVEIDRNGGTTFRLRFPAPPVRRR